MGASAYSRERLAWAARESRTFTEAVGKLGGTTSPGTRRYIRERMRLLGVDTSHFEREGLRWTREILAPVVAVSSSMSEVLRRLEVDVVGGQHTHISRRVAALGISTAHFRPRVAGAAVRRRGRRRPEDLLVRQDPQTARRVPSDRLKRAMATSGTADACSCCGTPPVWRGRPLPLEVDHIDGDWRNNLLPNLRLLCPNCHSATDTYRGRKKRRRP